ncbi:MAG: 1-deoxy-D-xylulose-5-phosphate reductoisomerase [Myxococcales bacterium]|nr:1-deoxy-D-xylulose-5-phosphate reductoisomerase [Myxococcales bacterium]
MNSPRGVVVLGATGSVGRQALQVVAAFPERFRLAGVAARSSVETMAEIVEQYRPPRVIMGDGAAAAALRQRCGTGFALENGEEALCALAAEPQAEIVVAAMAGQAGLLPLWAALGTARRVALANKEALVMAGAALMARARANGAEIRPVDSEHAAIHQLLRAVRREEIRRLVLTASGGPFLDLPPERLASVGVSEALRHPRWSMGPKVSIDSATLMNKGFEIIEAHWLFDLPEERIGVLIHPQSVVHGMLELRDGSTLAQLGPPDMRLSIAWALAGPERLPLDRLDSSPPLPVALSRLDFSPGEETRFPALGLCRKALRRGGGAPAALAAADEAAVEAFREGHLPFARILPLLADAMARLPELAGETLEDALRAGREGRRLAEDFLSREGGPA